MFLQDNIKGKKESSCSKLYILLIVLSFILIIGISTGLAEVVEWGVTGHYYEIIDESISWYDAKAAAESLTYLGLRGHLVTITSAEENKWITDTFGENALHLHWIGGYQLLGSQEPDSGWAWITGELWNFNNWWPGEPNNAFGTEDAIVFDHGVTLDGKAWNDLTSTGTANGYLVEYDLVEYGRAVVDENIPVQGDKDAPSHINFDPYPVYQHNDIYNWALGPSVRLAPIDRIDDRRPADGVILEDRAVMEFDLSNILGLHPNEIDTAVLRLNVWFLENVASARILVRGYDGDGLISADDFGSIKGFSPEPDLGFSFNPVPLSDLGSIVVASTGGISIDITSFIKDLVGRGIQWAGINLKIYYNSLPDRTTLNTDTTFGVVIYSGNSPYGPHIKVKGAETYNEGELVPITGGKVVDNESAAFITFPPGVLDHPTSVNVSTRTKTITCQIGNQDFRDGERFYGVGEWNPPQLDEQGDDLVHTVIGIDGFYSAIDPYVVIDPGVNFSTSYRHYCQADSGDIIQKAELTLGLGDMDTAAPGNQVDRFNLDGIPQPKHRLERAVSNNIAMITSVDVDPGLLADGILTVDLALKGPGLEGPIWYGDPERETPSNSAGIDFCRFDLTVRYPSSPITNIIGYTAASEVVYFALSGSVLSGAGAEIGLPVSGSPYKTIDPSRLRLFKYDDNADSWSSYEATGSIESLSLASGEITMFVAKGVHHFSTFVFMEANEPGDLDGDSDVDRDDLQLILQARNQPADDGTYGEGNDPRDLDGDGMITVLDARKLVIMCTRSRCETE